MKVNRRERKKLHSKKAIVDAAVRLFGVKGYQDTTVADIMNEADLGIGTFYNYFATKEEILKYLLEEILQDTNRVYEGLLEEEKSAAQLLEEMFLFTAETVNAKRFVLPLFISAVQKGALPKEHAPQQKGLTFKAIFGQILQAGQENGEFRRDIPADVITEMFHSVLQSASFSSLPIAFMDNIKYKLRLLMDGLALGRQRK